MLKKLFILLSFTLCFSNALANANDFSEWKEKFISKHAGKNLPASFLQEQLKEVEFDPSIIERDRNQLTSDTTINYKSWIQRWLNSDPARIERGKELLQEHAELLGRIEKKYQVDKEAIVALWGVETLYGNITGNRDIVSSLATLAYDKRRSEFFTAELVAALKILREGHIDREDFKGSWAGATGQCQFMPTSFRRRALDFDGDGKKNIWKNHGDIFASIANYLKKAGWQKGKSIGMLAEKTRPVDFNLHRLRTPAQYNQLGLRQLNGDKIEGEWRRKVAEIPHKNSPLILRGSNYRPLMRWNRSSLFAALNIILMEEFQEDEQAL